MGEKKEEICKLLRAALGKTEQFKEMYAMTYIESQNCIIAYFHGRKIVRIWLDDKYDDFEMIREIINVLAKEDPKYDAG